jgi:hypothetical protein
MSNILCLAYQIARVFPTLFKAHVKTMHPYIRPGANVGPNNNTILLEERISVAAIAILTKVIPFLRDADMQLMNNIEGDLLGALSRRSIGVGAPALC